MSFVTAQPEALSAAAPAPTTGVTPEAANAASAG